MLDAAIDLNQRAWRRHWSHAIVSCFRKWWVLGLGVAISCVLEVLTALSNGYKFNFGAKQQDFYNELTNGFLSGHLSLPGSAPKGLLKLANPYDPTQNAAYNSLYHDLALYHGHFYLTWGPTPVVTLFLPWRLLHVGAIPPVFAVLLYCIVGLLASAALLWALVSHLNVSVRPWHLAIAGLALGASSVACFLIRSPLVYEVNIASSYCFSILGAYLIVSGLFRDRFRFGRLASGSACLGLAAGGHQDEAVLAVLVVGVFLGFWSRCSTKDERWRFGVSLFGPFAFCILALLVYNYARFGSPFEVGARYAITGYNPQKSPIGRLDYMPPNLFYYVIAPVRWVLSFPYFKLPPPPLYPGTLPATYSTTFAGVSTEVMGGVFTTTPIVFALFGLPRMLKRRLLSRDLGVVLTSFVMSAIALLCVISFAIPGGSFRYEADFAWLLLVVALVIWLVWANGDEYRRRRWASVVGAIAALYGAAIGVAVSMTGYHDNYPQNYADLQTSAPSAYWALGELTSPLPTLYTMLAGHPILAQINSPRGLASSESFFDMGVGKNLFFYLSPQPTEVEVVSPGSRRAILEGGFNPGPAAQAHKKTLVTVVDNGRRSSFTFTPGWTSIPIQLHTGLNRISLRAAQPGDSPRAAIPIVQVYQFLLGPATKP